MTTPNLVQINYLNGNTAVQNVTTTATAIISNANNSNQLFRIDSLVVANYSTNVQYITADIYRNNVPYIIVSNISMPANTTFGVFDRIFYANEGDAIRLTASNNGTLQAVATYEVMG